MSATNPYELLSYLLIEEGKRAVMSVLQDLIRLDQRLHDIALCLPVPPEVPERWDTRDPLTVAIALDSMIEAVRRGELRRVIECLKWAAQQSPLSLWLLTSGSEEGAE